MIWTTVDAPYWFSAFGFYEPFDLHIPPSVLSKEYLPPFSILLSTSIVVSWFVVSDYFRGLLFETGYFCNHPKTSSTQIDHQIKVMSPWQDPNPVHSPPMIELGLEGFIIVSLLTVDLMAWYWLTSFRHAIGQLGLDTLLVRWELGHAIGLLRVDTLLVC